MFSQEITQKNQIVETNILLDYIAPNIWKKKKF